MNNVPNWQLLMLAYFFLVGVPVFIVHNQLKKKVLANKTPLNLVIYFTAVVATAFMMNFITMFLYYKFLFTHKP